jgi:hypothetical protein
MIKFQNKIFCVGFHQTGTTILEKALNTLVYKVKGPFGVSDKKIRVNTLIKAKNIIPKYDAFQDNPWPILYKVLDSAYPESKFILAIRDSNSWIKSQIKYFNTAENEMRKWIYGHGSPVDNEQLYIDTYEEYIKTVITTLKIGPITFSS